MYLNNTRVEKRGTRYWVVIADTEILGEQRVLHEGITKKSCLQYIEKQKRESLRALTRKRLLTRS